MSYKEEEANKKLNEKYQNYSVRAVVRLDVQLHGPLKNQVYQELKSKGISESKLILESLKFYFANKPDDAKNQIRY